MFKIVFTICYMLLSYIDNYWKFENTEYSTVLRVFFIDNLNEGIGN